MFAKISYQYANGYVVDVLQCTCRWQTICVFVSVGHDTEYMYMYIYIYTWVTFELTATFFSLCASRDDWSDSNTKTSDATMMEGEF